jgi:hypothetical protein
MAAKPTIELTERPIDVQRAILVAEKEAYENTVFQARLRIEIQERIKLLVGTDTAELIKSLTKTIEESMAALQLLGEKLAALPEEPAKAA